MAKTVEERLDRLEDVVHHLAGAAEHKVAELVASFRKAIEEERSKRKDDS
jgi:hypothetical protein